MSLVGKIMSENNHSTVRLRSPDKLLASPRADIGIRPGLIVIIGQYLCQLAV